MVICFPQLLLVRVCTVSPGLSCFVLSVLTCVLLCSVMDYAAAIHIIDCFLIDGSKVFVVCICVCVGVCVGR